MESRDERQGVESSIVAAIAVIQARIGSSRLPGKVLAPLGGGRSVLEYAIARCRLSRRLAGVAVATSEDPADDAVARAGERQGVTVHRGSQSDVLARYVGAADRLAADPLVRLTADSPLLDPANIDEVLASYARAPADYVCVEGYPLGLGIAECISAAALRRAHAETTAEQTFYREHVTTYLIEHPASFALRITAPPPPLHRPELRLTIDQPPDLEVA